MTIPFDIFWKVFKYPIYLVLIFIVAGAIIGGIGDKFGAPGVILFFATLGIAGWLYLRKRLPTRKAEL